MSIFWHNVKTYVFQAFPDAQHVAVMPLNRDTEVGVFMEGPSGSRLLVAVPAGDDAAQIAANAIAQLCEKVAA